MQRYRQRHRCYITSRTTTTNNSNHNYHNPTIPGRDLQEVARANKYTAGGLDGWAWNEIKALPLPRFSGLAILLELVESTGIWPQGLLDAYIAMIPKADGDSTPLGQRPLSVLPVVYRLWASLRLGHLREWVEGWLP